MFHRKSDPGLRSQPLGSSLSQPGSASSLTARHSLPRFTRQLWDYARGDDRRLWQIVVALACLFVTLSMELAYVGDHYIAGWQLGVWALCAVTITIVLAPLTFHRPRLDAVWRILLIVVLLAFVLRFVVLDAFGLHVDEMGFAGYTMDQVLTGGDQTISPFIVGLDSHPTLYFYLVKLFLSIFGYTISGLRLSSVLAGTLAVLATYGCVASLSTRRIALLTAILMAAYHFHIHWSRLALNNIWDTVWIPAMIGVYAWGWKKHNSAGAALAGATLGLSQYFYQGGRLGIILLGFVIGWLWWHDRDRQRLVLHLGKLTAVALCIAGPLMLYALAEPEPFLDRFMTVFGWRPSVIQEITGNAADYWGFFWYQLARSVGAYTTYPDITGFYRPDTPLTIGLSMIMLPIGFGWAIVKRMWVPALWLTLATFFGGFMLAGAPSSSHYVIAIPAICWLIAIAIDLIIERGHLRLALTVLTVIVLTDLVFYFVIYLRAPSGDLSLPFPPIPFS